MSNPAYTNIREAIYTHILKEENEWLERWLKPILPPVVFRWANEGRHTAFVTRYCERHGIKIYIYPDRKVLMHAGIPVAQFQVTFKNLNL